MARINYRSDTDKAVLSVTADGMTIVTPIDKKGMMVLLESIAEALKKMEDNG